MFTKYCLHSFLVFIFTMNFERKVFKLNMTEIYEVHLILKCVGNILTEFVQRAISIVVENFNN